MIGSLALWWSRPLINRHLFLSFSLSVVITRARFSASDTIGPLLKFQSRQSADRFVRRDVSVMRIKIFVSYFFLFSSRRAEARNLRSITWPRIYELYCLPAFLISPLSFLLKYLLRKLMPFYASLYFTHDCHGSTYTIYLYERMQVDYQTDKK